MCVNCSGFRSYIVIYLKKERKNYIITLMGGGDYDFLGSMSFVLVCVICSGV